MRPHCQKCGSTILGGSLLVETTSRPDPDRPAERAAVLLCESCGELVTRWLTSRAREARRLEPITAGTN